MAGIDTELPCSEWNVNASDYLHDHTHSVIQFNQHRYFHDLCILIDGRGADT